MQQRQTARKSLYSSQRDKFFEASPAKAPPFSESIPLSKTSPTNSPRPSAAHSLHIHRFGWDFEREIQANPRSQTEVTTIPVTPRLIRIQSSQWSRPPPGPGPLVLNLLLQQKISWRQSQRPPKRILRGAPPSVSSYVGRNPAN